MCDVTIQLSISILTLWYNWKLSDLSCSTFYLGILHMGSWLINFYDNPFGSDLVWYIGKMFDQILWQQQISENLFLIPQLIASLIPTMIAMQIFLHGFPCRKRIWNIRQWICIHMFQEKTFREWLKSYKFRIFVRKTVT